jgi:glyoxylase-like metal-dependent hydrolase (beta-lactamase superfamily II)
MKLIKIETGNFMADGGALFGVVPKMMWKRQYPCDKDNYCNLTMRCLLVDTGDRRVLIDTGAGSKQSDKFFSWHRLNGEANLNDSLLQAGYKADDITDIILTHLHWDHCGGCVSFDKNQKAKLNFKNARHWVSMPQWENYKESNSREEVVYFPENMRPVEEAGLLHLVEQDKEILSGIELRLLHGHTRGNVLPLIHHPKGTVAFMGDLIPVAPSIRLPWVSAYDTNPLQSIEEKRSFLEEAVANNYTLFFEHDLYTECCSLNRKEGTIVADQSYMLNDRFS